MRVVRFQLLAAFVLTASALAGCLDGGDPGVGDGGLISNDPFGHPSAVVPGSWSVFPGPYNVTGRISSVLERGPYTALEPFREVLTSAIDGADIDMSIWLADAPADVKQPVIVQASPYYADTINPGTSDLAFGVFNRENFVPHGYAYVQLAIRSTGNSGGCDDFRGPNMVADMSQAITWLAEQPWSNGNVGLIGISYPGGTPMFAAGAGNPALKTIVPASGAFDAWETYLRNGTPEQRAPIIVASYGASPFQNANRSNEHKVENVPCAETYQFWATATGSGATGERLDPQWWDTRNAKPSVEANYKGSVFLVQGLEDWNVDPATSLPWVDTLTDRGITVKQLLGQWHHNWPDGGPNETRRLDWAEMLLHWYDYWLKGDTTVDTGPPVQVQDNQMRWRDELHWPPRDVQWTTYHLSGDGQLTLEEGAPGSRLLAPYAEQGGLAAAAPVAGQVAFIDFDMGTLEQGLRIAGLPQAHITVRPTGPGGFLGAWLLDVDPAGEAKRIGFSAMNLRYADGGRTAEDVVPMQPLVARTEMQPMDAYVEAGHKVVLRLWMVPTAERIPNAPMDPLWVDWGGDVESVLHLPVIERGDEVFFTPPMPVESD